MKKKAGGYRQCCHLVCAEQDKQRQRCHTRASETHSHDVLSVSKHKRDVRLFVVALLVFCLLGLLLLNNKRAVISLRQKKVERC